MSTGLPRPCPTRCTLAAASAALVAFPVFSLQQQNPTSIVMAFESSATVMYVGAHPDDETSVAAFLARSLGDGKKVVIVCLTRGENDPRGSGIGRGSALAKARSQWLRESADLIGAEAVPLDFVSGPLSLAELDRDEQSEWLAGTTPEQVIEHWRKSGRDPLEELVRAIRAQKPDLILTWPKEASGTGDVEHRAAAALVERALVDAGNRYMFPEHARIGLKPWQPKFVFAVRKDADDGNPSTPVEEVGCDAPATSGRNACQVKAQVLAAYRRHAEQITSPEKIIEITREAQHWAEGHPEYLQLVRDVRRPR